MVEQIQNLLPKRWTKLRYHAIQQAYLNSVVRFNVVPAGRRGGKTEIAKRRCIRKAMMHHKYDDGNYVLSAPTHGQAKKIYWADAKRLTPMGVRAGPPSESALSIPLINGAVISVVGLDVPERIEGPPIDHIVLDEYGNMKPKVWTEHIRPGLSDRLGTADFIGVPEGRNHYYDLYSDALSDESGDWVAFTWPSADILPAEEIAAAKRDLDELSYKQEYEASFVVFQGLAYYTFNANVHAKDSVPYTPTLPLNFCFDFNIAPGVAVTAQEPNDDSGTRFIKEVYIPQGSNTRRVCDKLIEQWSEHKGRVYCFGDATGGAGGTAKVDGSDWDIIRAKLLPIFGDKLRFEVPSGNPRERARVNAVNSRLQSVDGSVKVHIDRRACPQLVKDFEGVQTIEGSAGDIDKSDSRLTHLTDAVGYYIVRKFPTVKHQVKLTQL